MQKWECTNNIAHQQKNNEYEAQKKLVCLLKRCDIGATAA